jgi:DNA-binding MarR family transcriptional regulator
MEDKYDILKQIIDLWGTYEEKQVRLNLLDFVEWIANKIKEEPALNKRSATRKLPAEYSEHFAYIKILDEKARFLEYISRIARFQEFYTRKFFHELPLNSRLEYMFLYTVSHMNKAKKTDLINIHSVEYTTGMDTIRRLINNGLLEEKQDEADKRAKLLVITEYGKNILRQADRRISDERNMFLACISVNKWKKTLPVLEEMNDFHNNIYLNHNSKPYPELLNLMDSLKHLYK